MTKLEQIKAFATSSFAVAAHTVRMGFELETQLFDDVEYDGLVDQHTYQLKPKPADMIAIKLEIGRSLRYILATGRSEQNLIAKILEIDPDEFGMIYNNDVLDLFLKLTHIDLDFDDDDSHASRVLIGMIVCFSDERKAQIVDILTDLAMSNANIVSSFIKTHTRNVLIPAIKRVTDAGLTFERDGSVSGPEIQTDGPRTYRECMKSAEFLFNTCELEIDDECSFHIHLSIPGIKHVYGRNLQIALMLSVLIAPDRPCNLHSRWNYTPDDDERDDSDDIGQGWLERYFEVTPIDVKNTFVAFRGETWEFRGFGNVVDTEDANWCLKTAVKSMQRGYRLLHGFEELPGYAELCRLGDSAVRSILQRLVRDRDADAALFEETMTRRGYMSHVGDNLELEAA